MIYRHYACLAYKTGHGLLRPTLIVSALAISLSGSAFASSPPPSVPGEVIVGLKPETDRGAKFVQSFAVGKEVAYQPALHAKRIRLNPGVSTEQAIAELRKRADVTFAEPNYIRHADAVPNDLLYSEQWSPGNIQADKAWSIYGPKQNVVVAVVDSGVDSTHPDLANKMYRDGSGIVGYNALTGLRDDALDDYGHGTHCAGIIGAQANNSQGVAGITGWNTVHPILLMPVKVLDSGGNTNDATLADGITWAADHGAKVISMSLGGSSSGYTLDTAIAYAWGKGVVLVASAGNSSNATQNFPAACANVVSVASTDSSNTISGFSSYGSWVTVAAPGDGIMSTLPLNPTGGNFGTNYGYLSGTSMACPHVAAEAAMIAAQNPALSNAQVRAIIATSVDGYNPYNGETIQSGGGRINLLKALQAAGASSSTTVQLTPISDSFVRAGSASMSTNYGVWTTLWARKCSPDENNANNFGSYMKFDLSHVTSAPRSAVLTLTTAAACWPTTGTMNLQINLVSNSWTEPGITCANAVNLSSAFGTTGTVVKNQTVSLAVGARISIDLTSFVAGHLGQQVTLQLLDAVADGHRLIVNSRQASTGKPTLTISAN